MRWLKRDLRTVVVAVVAATVTAGAPALAHGVQHALFAHNADKVDGKHAVGAGATLSAAAGKLVATGATGRFGSKFMPSGFAGPRAFAAVDYEAVDFIVGSEHRGIAGVRRQETGVYCLEVTPASGIDPETAISVVGVNYGFSAGADLLAFWNQPDSCDPDEIEVLTYKFDGGLVASNEIAFSVAVL